MSFQKSNPCLTGKFMRAIFLAAVLSAAFVLFPFWNVDAQPITLRYGQIPSTIKTISALSLYIGQRKGFFAQEEINLEMRPIEGGAANMVVALNKGVVDITRTATPYLIQDVLKGAEGVAIAGETLTPIYSLMAKPEIKTFADLKGKVVGLSLAVDTISISTRKLMAKNGIKEGDFKVKELVGTPARADCLRKGDCDAVPLGQPEDFVLMKQGFERLGTAPALPGALHRLAISEGGRTSVRYARGSPAGLIDLYCHR
jgi:ABC-type nitrate/sulfonate/bicarbonate transport system substrate-binding protein